MKEGGGGGDSSKRGRVTHAGRGRGKGKGGRGKGKRGVVLSSFSGMQVNKIKFFELIKFSIDVKRSFRLNELF